MLPLFSQAQYLSYQNVPVYYPQYPNVANFYTLPSEYLISQQALRYQLLRINQAKILTFPTCFAPQETEQIKLEVKNEAPSTPSLRSLSSETPLQSLVTIENTNRPKEAQKENFVLVKKQNLIAETQIPNFPILKAQLEQMILFLLANLGRSDQTEIERARRRYSHNVYLIPIFDILVAKYSPIRKQREDIIRYIIRKALKFMKKDIIKKTNVYGKRAYAILCKRYFQINPEEMGKSGVKIQDEKDLIEFLLPYRKNSKNRTMNTNFTSEIFASKEFRQDFKSFLDSFDSMVDEDNNKKVQKLLVLAQECILNSCPEDIKKSPRLPWLDAWVEKTKQIAFSLLETEIISEDERNQKKVKIEYPYTAVKFESP